MRRSGECRRGACTRRIDRAGLCAQHYRTSADRGYIDPTPTRNHITALNEAGMSFQAIATEAAMTEQGIYYILRGSQTVQKATAQRILRIPIGGAGLVPCLGSRRRVQALAVMGWTQKDIAARIGEAHKHLSQFIQRERISADKASRIAAVYDQLSMTHGPSQRSRVRAKAAGWLPPLAWDDIDDPNETPELKPEGYVSFIDRYTELVEMGLSHTQIAPRMGIRYESLARGLARYGVEIPESVWSLAWKHGELTA